MAYNKLIFEYSQPGRTGYKLPKLDVEEKEGLLPEELISDKELDLPEVSEVDVIRHYTNLSNLNFGVDTGMYPLGSCTMKYNPKINEEIVSLPGFAHVHPKQDLETVQGTLELMYTLEKYLAEIGGMDYTTLTPAAGAHGELTAITIFKKYHEVNGNTEKDEIIVPDSAHGTNPATAAMAGYKIVEVKSNEKGVVDVEDLKEVVNEKTAGLMLTNPNTLGLYESKIDQIADIVHGVGGLLYYDGANSNAVLGKSRPGDMGFDAMHYNTHKTFSTPHGGGGPGAGPVAVKEFLKEFLPRPLVEKDGDKYVLNYDLKNSIGRMKDFQGQVGILVRALVYIMSMGSDGLKEVSEIAVLNANYLAAKLKSSYDLVYDTICKHEFVVDGLIDDHNGEITTLDVAKRLLDMGFHPPTTYFPLIVTEALMVEPTETESKQTLDEFIAAMEQIADEAKNDPEKLHNAPLTTVVRRPDETKAAKDLILTYNMAVEAEK
ncbi:MAG: aminomethyl-transferring glycine dehydrogenase subunit GcvPB [Finegoldia sp.]|nr:aminomethyl-transferring glycine dehydrogenase subunit GcvPB [Finegoldia sp.]